ncbi:MAG: FtsX-like permease family protein [Candidatus Eisenbacteria bacterium]|uniref:FtsX-like permease family protein n=1 Tax=Eiseniibacteriota bacterium TaxID=2212470 RepID=A0A933SH01_UNCEI|nr:FtsX-like permease family protein [Candidatus Eisenbacteria bacterium]
MTITRWLALRPLLRSPGRTLASVLGVALGVAVFVAIRLASGSALAAFSDTVDAVTGRANLQVVARGDGFDETLYTRVRAVPGVQAAAPVVQVTALARPGGFRPAARPDAAPDAGGDTGPRYDETLLVLGLDAFVEAPFFRMELASGERGERGAGSLSATGGEAAAAGLRLLAEPRTIAITRTLASRHGLRVDDSLTVLASGVPTPMTIAAVIESEALQQAMGGNVVITDIATAQEVFGREGRLDRVDLLVAPERRDSVRAELARLLPPTAAAELPQGRTKQVENMVRAFALNLTALSFIAVFVSTFLIFNTMAMSVVRRRRDIGVLRALGMTRGAVARLWLSEAAAIGVLGSALGLVLGTLLARGALRVVGRTLTDLYLVQQTDSLRLDPFTLAVGASLGLFATLGSALLPALEAGATAPGATLRQGQRIESQPLPLTALGVAAAVSLALMVASALWSMQSHVAWGGFAAAFFAIVGFSLLAPGATLAMSSLAAPRAGRLGGIEAALGARALREAVARASTVVAALTVAVGMLVALHVMVGSFRRTVDTWITQTIKGDLYVEPVGHRTSGSATVLPPDLVQGAREIPGVAAVDTYRATPITMNGLLAFAIGIDLRVQRDFGRLSFTSGEDARTVLGRALEGGGVIVSESFAHRHRVKQGDVIALPAAGGAAQVRVEGVLFDYSTDAGAVLMDAATYARLWNDDRTESLALYVKPGASADSVRAAFVALCGPERLMHVTPNAGLRRRVLAVFDQTFQVTWALQGIAVLVAVLGVVSTLTALVLQRGREIGMLRANGATRAQVRRMVLVESGLLGLTGALLGCVAGVALAVLLVQVINKQFFGWTVRFQLEPGIMLQAVALMVVVSALAGLFPAQLAAGRAAAEAMREE